MNFTITNNPPRGFARTMSLVLLSIVAFANTASAQPVADRWRFTIAPYFVGPSMDGDMAIKGRGSDVSLDPGDIFDHLEFGLMGMAAAQKGDWGVTADAIFVALGSTTSMPPADVDPTLGIYSLQGIRRVNDYADLTFGARWTHLHGRVDFKVPIPEIDESRDWVDPIVGVTLHTPWPSRFHGTLLADVGGFGAASDFTWQISPFVGYQVARGTSLEVGYRLLDTDYEDGEGPELFQYDMLVSGPTAGIRFNF